jgi:hypothetical protein
MRRTRKAYELDEDHEHFAKELANDIVEPLNEYLRFDKAAVSIERQLLGRPNRANSPLGYPNRDVWSTHPKGIEEKREA